MHGQLHIRLTEMRLRTTKVHEDYLPTSWLKTGSLTNIHIYSQEKLFLYPQE